VNQKKADKKMDAIRQAVLSGLSKKEHSKTAEKIAAGMYANIPHKVVTVHITPTLAEKHWELPSVQYDRKENPHRSAGIKESMGGCIRLFDWVVAVCKDADGVYQIYRLNGKHSSSIIQTFAEYFPVAPTGVLSVYYCANMAEVRSVYKACDWKGSSRGLGNLLLIEYGGNSRLVSNNPQMISGILQKIISGVCFALHGPHVPVATPRWDQLSSLQRCRYVHTSADFIIFVSRLWEGKPMSGSSIKSIQKFSSAPIVGALYTAWLRYSDEERGRFATIVARILDPDANTINILRSGKKNKTTKELMDDPVVQFQEEIDRTTLSVRKKLRDIEELSSYEKWFGLTCQCLYNAMNGIKGPLTWDDGDPNPYL
jgi:hypothetical protein